MSEQPHIVVIGGGIAGLAAARRLAPHTDVQVTLLEAQPNLGGKIQTETFAGRPVDFGAEALLARQPAAIALARELGLGDELVAPAADQAYVWTDALRPLPPGLLAGAPGGGRALLRSGLLSPAGMLRAGLDLVLPSRAPTHDVSIGDLVRGRLGGQLLERIVDPLLGGIHAGSCDDLSVRATAPHLAMALDRHKGLVRGMRAMAAAAPAAPASPFVTLRGGLGSLVETLAGALGAVDVQTDAEVRQIVLQSDDRYLITCRHGAELVADQVLLAVPAYAAAQMLDVTCAALADELRGVEYASVATVALAFDPSAVALPPGGSGFLVPRAGGRTVTASTWSSAKWAHLAGDTTIIKCSVGHAGSDDALVLDDAELLAAVRRDLTDALSVYAGPVATRIVRFPSGIPQYNVGHLDRVARIDDALGALPGVHLAGAAYRGVGVAACANDGTSAAERALARLDIETPDARTLTSTGDPS